MVARILGIWDGHDAGAAVLVAGRVIAAVSEERLTRRKHQAGFPRLAIASALRVAGLRRHEITHVAVAGQRGRAPLRLLDERYGRLDPANVDPTSAPSALMAAFENRLAALPGLRQLDLAVTGHALGRRLAEEGLDLVPTTLVDHHRAHAWSAATVSETLPDAPARAHTLIVSWDGYGDGTSLAVWRYDGATLTRLRDAGPEASPALLYGMVTRLLGFRSGEEGKVTGLAGSRGALPLVDLADLLRCVDGTPAVDRRGAYKRLQAARQAGVADEHLARSLQSAVEKLAIEAVSGWILREQPGQLALAGGLFANVALNGRIVALASSLGVRRVDVFPAMGDAGLCVGAAAAVYSEVAGGRVAPEMPLTCCGPDPHGGGRPGRRRPTGALPPQDVARALARGERIALCRGALEFGPRALTHRSLLFDGRSRPDALRVGALLGRPAFMPFAPLVHRDAWSRVFGAPPDAIPRACAEMTVALPARADTRALAGACVHDDGTARPQRVDASEDPWLADVLTHFTAETGCPLVVNTSLNRHREPIAARWQDARAAARAAGATWLVGSDAAERLGPDAAAR